MPKELQQRGRAFWRHVTKVYELRVDELEVLAEACRILDALDAMRASITDRGYTVRGSRGQPVTHPLVAEIRQSRLALARLVAQLGLPDPEDAERPRSVSPTLAERGRRAAQSRWDQRDALRGAPQS